MIIRVDYNWVIGIDTQGNYTPKRDLHTTRIAETEDGKKVVVPAYSNPIGYYNSIASALKGIVRAQIASQIQEKNGETDLIHVIKIIEDQTAHIDRLLEKLKGI